VNCVVIRAFGWHEFIDHQKWNGSNPYGKQEQGLGDVHANPK
jgi:hypothetical protein